MPQLARTKLAITEPEHRILLALHRYQFLTSRQVCQLLFAYPSSLSHAREYMKGLTAKDFAEFTTIPKRTVAGGAERIYTLTRRGMQFLASDGIEIPSRARPYRLKELSYLFLTHTLELNNVLIAGELFARELPTVTLARMLHEHDLRKQPVMVDDGDGKPQPVMPDGFLEFHVESASGRWQVCALFELDRGTEHQRAWRQKVASLVRFAQGPYQQAFGTDAVTVCVITTAGQKRLTDLITWTEAELSEHGWQGYAELFGLTLADLTEVAPWELFTAQRWRIPFSPTPSALLEDV